MCIKVWAWDHGMRMLIHFTSILITLKTNIKYVFVSILLMQWDNSAYIFTLIYIYFIISLSIFVYFYYLLITPRQRIKYTLKCITLSAKCLPRTILNTTDAHIRTFDAVLGHKWTSLFTTSCSKKLKIQTNNLNKQTNTMYSIQTKDNNK